ncbi:MAG: AbrB/MazE/SpoVT family DNA-binding domain-containing protein [Methylococcaceae bacterium]|nr:AbrB/MazE/SpoVT family DNA-binding domain-containing protein [Methylococcaceae bacterium]
MNQMVTIGKSGRLVIPAQYRKALGLTEGEGVMMSLKNGHIEISPLQESIKKAQKKVKKYLQPNDNLVEMLFDDRKEEFTNES